MKAMAIEKFGDQLKLMDLPKPAPGAGQLLIRVKYAGCNPVDWKICEGYLKERLPHKFPLIPGWDVAGPIEAVGQGVDAGRVGQEVFAYARKPEVQWGCFGEYVVVDAQHVALIPKKLGLREAAVVPLAGLTAWQAVVEFGQVGSGQSVLIHAGAGGVGGYAIQFAHHFGARVTTTASEKHHAYVQRLGADVVIDYTKVAVTGSYDFVFDTVGGEVFEQSWKLVRPGGKLASILQPIDEARAKAQGITGKYVFTRPEGEHLKAIAQLFDRGELQAPAIQEFPLEKAADALNLLRAGHVQGKLVLKVD